MSRRKEKGKKKQEVAENKNEDSLIIDSPKETPLFIADNLYLSHQPTEELKDLFNIFDIAKVSVVGYKEQWSISIKAFLRSMGEQEENTLEKNLDLLKRWGAIIK
jgi:hypothetical protein